MFSTSIISYGSSDHCPIYVSRGRKDALVQALIPCRLDNCNSLFYSITEGLMSWLQSVQNAAAHLVSGARRYDHITPVLCRLPVRRRVHFKMATLVYLSRSGMASAYLATNCQLVSDEGRRQLRSATSWTCLVRRTCRQLVSQLQVRSCGTAFQLNCDKLTLAFNDLSGY